MGVMKSMLKKRPREDVATTFMKHTESGKTPVIALFRKRFPSRHSLLTNSTTEITAYAMSVVLF
jgi:hypothetical protein